MAIYRGIRTEGSGCTVTKDGKLFSHLKSCKVLNHSPTGFEWGYGGSAPAQLALALLMEVTSAEEAVRAHQRFKAQVISNFEEEAWELTTEHIEQWLEQWRKTVICVPTEPYPRRSRN